MRNVVGALGGHREDRPAEQISFTFRVINHFLSSNPNS